ncbi:MAG: DUF3298 and DUF4163 domain-containing protein [Clostridium sp.]|nr:DUF3298 and DUF4163 domain-containing protein [Clostridium sp.]
MKRAYTIIMLAAAFCLTACSQTTENVPEKETTQTASAEAAEEPTEQKTGEADTETTEAANPAVSSTAPQLNITSNYYDAGGDSYEYFSGTYPTIEVIGEDYPQLKEAVSSWSASYTDGYTAQAQEYLNNAKTDAESRGEDFYHYALDYSAAAARADNRVTCFTVDEYSYVGGAHGYAYLYGVTFDTATGDEITFNDLGDIKEEVRSYIDGYIADRENEGMEFVFYQENIDDCMDNPVWYLDGLGLNIVFNAYDIASYAAGRTIVAIPYDEMTNFNPDYKPEGTAIFAQMAANTISVDVNGDGTPETITLSGEYTEDGDTQLDLKVNDLSLDLGRISYRSAAYFARTQEGRAFVLISCDMMSDDYETLLIEVTSGTPVKADSTAGSLTGITSEICTVQASIYTLGTYTGQRSFTFSGGAFEPVEERYSFINNLQGSNRSSIILAKAVMAQINDNGTLTETELQPGTALYPTDSDGTSVIGFELEDGTVGELHFERQEDGMIYIDGVSEFDLFENLPYAG